MPEEKEWLSIAEFARWVGISANTIRQEVEAGNLPIVRFGSEIRINRDLVLQLAAAKMSLASERVPEPAHIAGDIDNHDSHIAMPRGMSWIEKPTPIPPFEHKWPHRAEDPENVEHYDAGWRGKIFLLEKEYVVLIGKTTRLNRGRLTIFFNGMSMCEFTETREGGWASLIKPDGKRMCGLDETPPALYRRTKIGAYREATGLTGRGIPAAAAVLIDKEDLVSAVHHATARWLARHHFPVESER